MPQFIKSDTRDARLFSAVAAMGVPWHECGAIDGKQRTWTFDEVSDCGRWALRDLLKWWGDSSMHHRAPGHEFHIVKACMASDKGLRKAFKEHTGFWQSQRGKANVVLAGESRDACKAHAEATDDSLFAAAASAVGFGLSDNGLVGRRRIVGISPVSRSFGYTLAQIRAWWADKTFEENNNQHPFAYAKAVALTYDAAIRAILDDRPLVYWSPPGSVGFCYIHPDCSAETEAKFAKRLRGE